MAQSYPQIAEILRTELQLPNVQVAILYGSATTGKLRPSSDIDVAVLFDQPLSAERRMTLAGNLQSRLNRPVDLVDLSGVTGTILQQILCTGKVVIKKNPSAYNRLLQRMIYNQADMMPYARRALLQHAERFAHG